MFTTTCGRPHADRKPESNQSRGSDSIGVMPNLRPLRGARQDKEGDAPRLEVLLVPDAPIGCEQQVEAGLLGCVQ